jgi:hypothetical protein
MAAPGRRNGMARLRMQASGLLQERTHQEFGGEGRMVGLILGEEERMGE